MKNTPVPAHRPVSLSLLVLAGLLCMGSGSGNPGCSSNEPAHCTELCAVEGSYRLSFEDSSQLPPGCQERTLSLPTGPLVISRDDGDLTTRLHNMELTGSYFGGASSEVSMIGGGQVPSPTFALYASVVLEGKFDPQPASTSASSVLKGRYKLSTTKNGENDLPCDVDRAFTATR